MKYKLHNPMRKKLVFGGVLLLTWTGISSILSSNSFLIDRLFAQEPAAKSTEQPAQAEDKPEAAAPAVVEASPEAVALLGQARERLKSYDSVKADLTETVLIGPRSFRSEGSYLQRGESEILFEFRLSIKGADDKPLVGRLLEVSNGQILWMSYQVGSELQVTRRDIEQILKAAEDTPSFDGELLSSQLGLGGLSGLMASLQRSMKFESISQETVDGNQYQMIAGGWSEEYMQKFKPDGAPDDFALPTYVPDRVRIFFDEKSLFPRRILYLKRVDGKSQPMLALDFFNVQTNIPVANDAFVFTPPPDILPQDITQDVILRIKAAANQPSQSAEKPAATAPVEDTKTE